MKIWQGSDSKYLMGIKISIGRASAKYPPPSVLKESKQPLHMDLLVGHSFSHALHVGNLVDGVHLAHLHRVDIWKVELIQSLSGQLDRDPLVGDEFAACQTVAHASQHVRARGSGGRRSGFGGFRNP